MMTNTLITVFGGTGFVGRHTVRALARAGFRVRVAVRYPSQGFFLPPMGHVGQIALVKCNVRNPEQVAAAIHGASGVVNLTGILFSRGRQNFNAVHVRHIQIKNDQIDRRQRQSLDRFQAAAGLGKLHSRQGA